jgi:hypothetical protein
MVAAVPLDLPTDRPVTCHGEMSITHGKRQTVNFRTYYLYSEDYSETHHNFNISFFFLRTSAEGKGKVVAAPN